MMLQIALLGLLAQDVDPKEDVYKRLALGDRVEITFRSGRTIAGKIVTSPQGQKAEKEQPIDFTKEKSLTVDLSLEYPGLTGTMTVKKDEVRAIRILGELSKEERANIEEQRKRIEAEKKKAAEEQKPPPPKAEPNKPPAPEPPKDKDKDKQAEAERKRKEDLKKGEALYAKYPPPDWGPDRAAAIRIKQLTGVVPPPIEREFLEGFDLWDLYRQTVVEAKKKPSGK